MTKCLALLLTALAAARLGAADAPDRNAKKRAAAAEPTTLMVRPGRVLCQEDFTKGMPPKPMWNPDLVGAWSVVDGWLNGSERAKDHHAAVCFANVENLPAACIIRVRFRIGEANDVQIMGQGKNGEAQRVTFLLQMRKTGFGLAAMSDKTATPPEPDTKWFPEVAQALDPNRWYQITLELNGDEALAYTDEQHVGYVRHPVFAKQRWGISLRTNGLDRTGSFTDVQLIAGEADPAWEKLRARFAGAAAKAGGR